MPRRMSCSMTVDAVRAHTKDVTRRHVDTWRNLKAGDRLTLIEKGMGLPKGAKQVVLTDVEIVDVRVEPLGLVQFGDEVTREGFPELTPFEFMLMWAKSHGYTNGLQHGPLHRIPCRRIEWRYLDATPGTGLAVLDPDVCPNDGTPLRADGMDEPALFLHGGYGATRRTVVLTCPTCAWGITREVGEISPREATA